MCAIQALRRSGNPVCEALALLAENVESGAVAVATFSLKNSFNNGHGLYGEAFRPHLAALDPIDTASLVLALSSVGVRPRESAEFIAQALTEDAARANTSGTPTRLRFGLHWAGSKPLIRPAYLRFNLRRPLTFQQPVIVLDGYADERYYAALVQEQPHIQFHTFDPGPRLVVEYDERLNIDILKDGKVSGRERRILVAEELAVQKMKAPDRPQVLITRKRLRDSGSEFNTLLRNGYTFKAPGRVIPQGLHWHAGRGINAHSGSDVCALNPPGLSPMYEDYTLADVFPDDPGERKRIKEHTTGSELLQMLNRGRQPDPAHAHNRPRIILATTEAAAKRLLGPLINRVELTPFLPHHQFKKKGPKIRWPGMMEALVGELLQHFPDGIPLELIGALPKYRLKTQAQDRAAVHLSALAQRCPTDSHLHRTFHDQAAWPYQSVPEGGGGSSAAALDESLGRLGLVAQGGKPNIYLPAGPGADAKRAWAAYRRFQDTGETAMLPAIEKGSPALTH